MFMTTSTMFMLSMIFFMLNTPLSMGLILILQTICMSILMGMMMKSFWFSYMLILIFIGGMLMMFLYVITLSTNKKFKFKYSYMKTLILMTTMFLLYSTLDPMMISPEMMYNKLNINDNLNMLNLMKMFCTYSNPLLILMVNYLFMTLMSVESIINNSFAPLRKMF
uniref:NADH dehydrogenase subunit 6 n=1 Tax=Stimulopalpus japonicus TaxID=209965 RepID=A0A343QCJ7_9NEOP|nr:NADH dehydrogenase subunit 6 [Stimulopalpus japonicus]ATU07144.1 NADH dehydrogenase subunit 6 [Stimulopalpus japonicus]